MFDFTMAVIISRVPTNTLCLCMTLSIPTNNEILVFVMAAIYEYQDFVCQYKFGMNFQCLLIIKNLRFDHSYERLLFSIDW